MRFIAGNRSRLFFSAASLWLIVMLSSMAQAADNGTAANVVSFEIAVIPNVNRYLELLAYPAYVAVALENNGLNPINSSRVIIRDGQTLQFRNVVVRYLERKDAVYRYEALIEWELGVTQASFKMPIEIDVAAISKDSISVRVYPPLAKLFPEELVDLIRIMVQSIATPEAQKKMLDYLDELAKKQRAESGVYGLIEQIMIHAYNQTAGSPSASVGREPGDAEPLSDQVLLLITLMIWVVAPLTLLGWRYWL